MKGFNFDNMCKLLAFVLSLWIFTAVMSNMYLESEVKKSEIEMHQAIARTVLESKGITIQGTKIEFNAVKGDK